MGQTFAFVEVANNRKARWKTKVEHNVVFQVEAAWRPLAFIFGDGK
jgi:hypothetical protein